MPRNKGWKDRPQDPTLYQRCPICDTPKWAHSEDCDPDRAEEYYEFQRLTEGLYVGVEGRRIEQESPSQSA